MVLLDAETGIIKAVLPDNGYLTDVRTAAAAGAVAARYLAPRRVRTAAFSVLAGRPSFRSAPCGWCATSRSWWSGHWGSEPFCRFQRELVVR